PHASWQHRTELALELLDELLGGAAQGLEGIGVGVVGPVTGAAERDLGVARRFGEQYGVPVLVDNNTRLAALAETVHGAGAGSRHVVYVRLSHGVGGGVVVDGRLLRGAGGTAGEIGHITVEPTGPRCQCGGHGCLELYASLPAVAAAGGPENDAAVARAGRLTGRMLAGLCAAVNPELLIVGGELARCGARLLTPLRTELRARTLSAARAGVRVVGERLGDEAGALGGMVLVRQETPALYGAPTGDAVALSMADRNAASADGCCTGPVASGSC
ncbi:ROK family protein, partial [Streptomyces clavuligerus]